MKLSIIINADTRPMREHATGLFNGAISRDFLLDGIKNKIAFFQGFDIELILFVDVHEQLSNDVLHELMVLCDKLVLSKHSRYYRGEEPCTRFNDINYLHALSLARGTHIAHFDQDTAAFTSSPAHIQALIDRLDRGENKFVSLPSANSPDPVHDDSFGGKWWASTRFFMCRREMIDLTALEHAIRDPEWAYSTYGRPNRINPWTEHHLTLIAGYNVFYPPIELDKWAAFSWSAYKGGTLAKMNALPYGEVANALHKAGGLPYDGVDANLLNL